MQGFQCEKRLPAVGSNVWTQTRDQTNNRARLKNKHPAYWSKLSLKTRRFLKMKNSLFFSAGRSFRVSQLHSESSFKPPSTGKSYKVLVWGGSKPEVTALLSAHLVCGSTHQMPLRSRCYKQHPPGRTRILTPFGLK